MHNLSLYNIAWCCEPGSGITFIKFLQRYLLHSLLVVHQFHCLCALSSLPGAAQSVQMMVPQEHSSSVVDLCTLRHTLTIHQCPGGSKVTWCTETRGHKGRTYLAPPIGVMKTSFSTISMTQCSLAIPKPLS